MAFARNIINNDPLHPVAIDFDRVTKEYHLYKNDRARALSAFITISNHEVVRANNALSFSIERGEAVAFIGDNGAGKSTLLKLITGVCYPTSGHVYVNGRVSAMLELSAGFDMNLTGLENLHLRGQIWGLDKNAINELIPDIVEFAELGSYINQPMRTYSSGMRARLGFAFATAIKPDILVVDEALSVGDKSFSKKCVQRIRRIMEESHVTVLFVTHSSSLAQEFCQRGIVLKKGHVVFDGYIYDAIKYYYSEY